MRRPSRPVGVADRSTTGRAHDRPHDGAVRESARGTTRRASRRRDGATRHLLPRARPGALGAVRRPAATDSPAPDARPVRRPAGPEPSHRARPTARPPRRRPREPITSGREGWTVMYAELSPSPWTGNDPRPSGGNGRIGRIVADHDGGRSTPSRAGWNREDVAREGRRATAATAPGWR